MPKAIQINIYKKEKKQLYIKITIILVFGLPLLTVIILNLKIIRMRTALLISCAMQMEKIKL